MHSKNEDEDGREEEKNPEGTGEGREVYIYVREVYRVEHPGSKRGRRDTQTHTERERELTQSKNEANSDGLEVNPRQEETDWRYLKLSFSQPDA